jgi:hypothetical protein
MSGEPSIDGDFIDPAAFRRKKKQHMTLLATLPRGACRSAEDLGLQLADAKPILGRVQEIVVSEQLQRY